MPIAVGADALPPLPPPSISNLWNCSLQLALGEVPLDLGVGALALLLVIGADGLYDVCRAVSLDVVKNVSHVFRDAQGYGTVIVLSSGPTCPGPSSSAIFFFSLYVLIFHNLNLNLLSV